MPVFTETITETLLLLSTQETVYPYSLGSVWNSFSICVPVKMSIESISSEWVWTVKIQTDEILLDTFNWTDILVDISVYPLPVITTTVGGRTPGDVEITLTR